MNILLGTFQECESLSSCVQETALFHKILFPPSHLAFQVIPLPHSSCDSSSLHTRSMSMSFIWQHLVIKWIVNSSLGQRTKLPLTAFRMVLKGLLLLVCWTWWIKLSLSLPECLHKVGQYFLSQDQHIYFISSNSLYVLPGKVLHLSKTFSKLKEVESDGVFWPLGSNRILNLWSLGVSRKPCSGFSLQRWRLHDG